VLLTPRP